VSAEGGMVIVDAFLDPEIKIYPIYIIIIILRVPFVDVEHYCY
jgi:hypothetical protein